MTRGQEDVMRWVRTEYPNASTEEIGEGIIRVTDPDGKQTDYSANIFGDILKSVNGKNQIIAVSDLPHNLDQLPMNARPTAWTWEEGG